LDIVGGVKFCLVAALLTMGISTVAIGLLPSYAKVCSRTLIVDVVSFGQGSD
jgi:hypothetical protein